MSKQQIPPAGARIERQLTTLTDRVNALCLEHESQAAPRLALSIDEAATRLAMSKSHFRRVFVDGGRVRLIPVGDRARIIDAEELRAAYERYKSDIRALHAADSPSTQ